MPQIMCTSSISFRESCTYCVLLLLLLLLSMEENLDASDRPLFIGSVCQRVLSVRECKQVMVINLNCSMRLLIVFVY